MKQILTILFILFLTSSGFAQDDKELSIFENSKNWKREVIKFPVEWAPKFKLAGFEELLFTPNWSNSKSNEFWSLVIGWKIDSKKPISLKEIETNFKGYFDGLMKPNHWAREFPEPNVVFNKKENGFIGTMSFFDGFHTGKMITVNIQGNQLFLKNKNTSIITFRLSPKKYNNEVWISLNNIGLKKEPNTIIKLDDSWGNETFEFPINFAPSINYTGTAEVRFPPKGWTNPEHANFWSYTYVWKINLDKPITINELSNNLETYFDGLNNIQQNKHLNMYKAVSSIIKIKTLKNNIVYVGNIKTYDRFATKKELVLNVLIDAYYYKTKKQGIIHFKFSPKDFGHKTWEMLAEVELNKKE